MVVVTAADEEYFHVLKGLIHSIRDLEAGHSPKDRAEIRVIDLGLGGASIEELSDHCHVLTGAEPLLKINRTDLSRAHLLSRAMKPFLRDYFPGYGVYIWLDADTWVQDLGALGLLARTARANRTALVPEIDRSYSFLYDKSDYHYRTNFDWVADSFGQPVARDLLYRPVLNSGVFAMRHDSLLWGAWRRHLAITFEKAKKHVSDQAAFNVAVYKEKIQFHPLPSWCNWLCCHALPRLDTQTLTFTEPALPHQKLGILHLTKTYMDREVRVVTDKGKNYPAKLDYLSLRRLRASAGG